MFVINEMQTTPARTSKPAPQVSGDSQSPLVWTHSVVHDDANASIRLNISHLSPPHDTDKVIVDDVFVPQELRGQGRGRALAKKFLAEAASKGLKVEFSENVASFFKSLDSVEASKSRGGSDPRPAQAASSQK